MIKKLILFLLIFITATNICFSKPNKDIVVDIMELSLDENIAIPAIDKKQHEAVVSHMTKLAVGLKDKGYKVESTRNGEVIIATIEADKLFLPNNSELKNDVLNVLSPFAELMNATGKYKFLIVMHNDNTGNEEYTYRLSESRVNAIYKWMEDMHINTKSVVPYALGDTQPLHPNNSRLNRKKNRRLEIYIIPDKQIIQLAKNKQLY